MNKKNLQLLGLEEGATAEQIEDAYQRLKTKLSEDRFLDGKEGNDAAEMLTKVERAHEELLTELGETANTTGGEAQNYAKVQELIKSGKLQEAQRLLDSFNERPAEWHYYQSVLFYRKNWVNESKKQLEIAMRLDGENERYKEAYKKLNDKIAYDAKNPTGENTSAYEGQNMNEPYGNQMGGNFCTTCLDCCTTYLCLDCLCNGCCR